MQDQDHIFDQGARPIRTGLKLALFLRLQDFCVRDWKTFAYTLQDQDTKNGLGLAIAYHYSSDNIVICKYLQTYFKSKLYTQKS